VRDEISRAQIARRYGPVAADLETLVRLVATDRLHPQIGSVEPWENIAAVIEALSARRIRGNAVLTIAPSIPVSENLTDQTGTSSTKERMK